MPKRITIVVSILALIAISSAGFYGMQMCDRACNEEIKALLLNEKGYFQINKIRARDPLAGCSFSCAILGKANYPSEYQNKAVATHTVVALETKLNKGVNGLYITDGREP